MRIKGSRKIKPKGIVGKDDLFDNSKFFMEHGVDLEKRTISIFKEIDESVGVYIRGIRKMLEIDPTKDINIELSTYGGDVYYSLALYDIITQCPCNVNTHATGPVMSSGLTIYLAGDYRYATDNVTFMAHLARDTSEIDGSEHNLQVTLSELKRINGLLKDLYASNSNENLRWWNRKLKTEDFYFDYETAEELNIINASYEE